MSRGTGEVVATADIPHLAPLAHSYCGVEDTQLRRGRECSFPFVPYRLFGDERANVVSGAYNVLMDKSMIIAGYGEIVVIRGQAKRLSLCASDVESVERTATIKVT